MFQRLIKEEKIYGTYSRCRFTKNKRGEIGLTYIYGIGRSTARMILDKAGISYDLKVEEWTDARGRCDPFDDCRSGH